MLVKVLSSIQQIIEKASPAPTNKRHLRGWKAFVDPEFTRAAESIYAFKEPLISLDDINLFKQCLSILGVTKEKASNPIPILEIEADFCLAINDKNGAIQAIAQLLDIADTPYSNEETEAVRLSALSSTGYWLGQATDRDGVEKLMVQVENKVLQLDQSLLNSNHIEDAAIVLSRIYGTDEALNILSPVLKVDVSADHTFHLSSLTSLARAMAHLQYPEGLDQILEVFERINWDDQLNFEGQSFLQVLPALGDGGYVKGLSRSVSIGHHVKDGFLCTRPVVLAAIAREYSKLNRPAHALLLLSQAIAGIKEVDDQDYRVTTRAMISEIAAEIAHQEENSLQLYQYALEVAQEFSSTAVKDLETHPFVKGNSAYVTVSALIGTLAWSGKIDTAMSWLRETPDGIWGEAAISNVARALKYHSDAEALLELLKMSQRLVGSAGFEGWVKAVRVFGHFLDQISEIDLEKFYHLSWLYLTQLDILIHKEYGFI
ncbi:MAG: hypothetical protein HS126_40000 [Anaerolineales bacterium]|nr:hypothetical protein [Anaerolineales bacterium]